MTGVEKEDGVVTQLKRHFYRAMSTMREDVSDQVARIGNRVEENSRNIESLRRTVEKLERNETPRRQRSIATRSNALPLNLPGERTQEQKTAYRNARRSLRFWPILEDEDEDGDLVRPVLDFLLDILSLPADFEENKIQRVRRIRTPGGKKIKE